MAKILFYKQSQKRTSPAEYFDGPYLRMRTDLAIIFQEQLCHTHIAIVLLHN